MRSLARAVFLVVTIVIGWSIPSWSQIAARITQPIDSRRVTPMRHGVHPFARPEFDQGALAPSQMIHHIILAFTRSAAQQQALHELLRDQQDPSSPIYHKWLTPEQFSHRFGISDSDLEKVKDWLTSEGFTIDEVARGKSYIAFSGSVAQVNSALHTELHQYVVEGEIHFANASTPSIPTALADLVSGIRSLHDFKPRPRVIAHKAKPAFTSSLSGNTYLAPDDFATIYELNALYRAGIDGTGQKIAVIGQTDLYPGDVDTFRSVSNLPINPPQSLLIPGPDPGVVDGDIQEASLDVQWAGAVAPYANIIYVIAGTSGGVFDALYYAINNNTAPVISISYGLCEPFEVSSGLLTQDENMLAQASAQGQTVVGPSGDNAATDCDSSLSAVHGLAVDFPASSPYVVAVGGTTFNENGGNYWNNMNDIYQGSALFYIPEIVWNDTPLGTGISGTGGGASQQFGKPSWQTGVGVPNDGFRDVPDISFSASPGHDGYITCVQGDCQVCVTTDANCPSDNSPGYRKASDQTLDIVGGTSAGVPCFAGLLALINQKMQGPQGNINQRLYQLAATAPYVFHDVTSGDNKAPCTKGTPDCPNGGSIGYTAGVGYDQTTGLGTVDGFNLVSNWSKLAPADFGISFFNPAITIARGNAANVLVVVRPQNGFNSNVNLTCSSNIVGVTCSVNPSIVSPDASATVTITVSPNASLRPFHRPQGVFPLWSTAFGIAAFVGIGTSQSGAHGRRRMLVVCAAMLIAAIVLVSCGTPGASLSGTGNANSSVTPGVRTGDAKALVPGTTITPSRPVRGPRSPYAGITVQGTSGNLSHSTQILVTLN